jgi:hypothetical protein
MAAVWTQQEIETLRVMWQSSVPIKDQMHLLPGRSMQYAFRKAKQLGFGAKHRGHSEMLGVVADLMADGKARAAIDVFKEIDIDLGHARELLGRLVNEGRAHITLWRQAGCNGQWQALYVIGAGVSQPKPKKMTQKQRVERFMKRIDPVEWEIRKQRYAARKRKAPRMKDPIIQALFGRAA